MSTHSKLWAAAIVLLLVAASPVTAAELASVEAAGTTLTLTPQRSAWGWQLRVSAPDGQVYAQEFGAKENPSFVAIDDHGDLLPDGSYVWELIALAPPRHRDRGGATLAPRSQTGAFSMLDGALVAGDIVEEVATKDQVIPDDLIVQSSLCVGFDCINGEVFNADTIRLKENNLRIHFLDTSTTAGFPFNDWRITVNDQNSGGIGRFSIEDETAGRTPFTIRAGAPNNALFVDNAGRVGIGTATPVLTAHIASGNTPALRLEQNNSSGFTPQTWDVAGNEVNFFVRDATNGSRLPLRIVPNAPSNSIFIAGTSGDVGIGTSAPTEELHVRRTDAAATRVLIQNTNASGNSGFELQSSSHGYRVTNANNGNLVFRYNDALNVLLLGSTGELTVVDTVTGTSAGSTICIGADNKLCRCNQCN